MGSPELLADGLEHPKKKRPTWWEEPDLGDLTDRLECSAVRKTENCSAYPRMFCARMHITQKLMPPCFFMYATTVVFLLLKTWTPHDPVMEGTQGYLNCLYF